MIYFITQKMHQLYTDRGNIEKRDNIGKRIFIIPLLIGDKKGLLGGDRS
jgi:hypothetical protein